MIMENADILTKETYKKMLSEGILRVNFVKVSGETRNMRCTLMQELIPGDHQPKGSGRVDSDEVVAVYDLDNKGWRSFRIDSVISVVAEGEFEVADDR